ncbi:MAG: ribokinase [Thermodesulfobacteriota bacterium]
MSRVIVLGSANTDLSVQVPRLPQSGETLQGSGFQTSFGGKGANQALAALYSGAETLLLARIGTDYYGQALFKHLQHSGLPVAGLTWDQEQPAGLALILVDSQGNNQIVVVPGSNQNLSSADVESFSHCLSPGDILLVQLEIPLPTVAAGLKLAKSRGLTTILDPAPYQPLPAEILANVDILTPNQSEAAALAGTNPDDLQGTEDILQGLLSKDQTLILTLGREGALVIGKSNREHVPAFQVQARDSVAAGDAFNGALAAGLAQGKPLSQALRLAGAAGALCSTRPGAQAALPSQAEIEELAGIRF